MKYSGRDLRPGKIVAKAAMPQRKGAREFRAEEKNLRRVKDPHRTSGRQIRGKNFMPNHNVHTPVQPRWDEKHHSLMPDDPHIPPVPLAIPLKELAAEKSGALNPGDTVQTAGDRMREHDAEVWPVAENRKLVGMIDEKNPDWKLGGHGHDPKAATVGQIMTRNVVFCYEDEDCAEARRKMEEHGLQFLPVVDRQMRIVGVFSREEIEEKAESSEVKGDAAVHINQRPAIEA